MSRLEELIRELCPEGVEYKPLKEISLMQRGTSITKKQVIDGQYPVISGGRTPAYYCDRYNRVGECITVAGSGAGAGYVNYWNAKIFVADAFSIVGANGTSTRYLYHCLANIQGRIYATQTGGGIPHVHISSVENFEFPVPPLPVQQEIVRILDSFTDLTAELEAELEARKKQYEYYRDQLLNFDAYGTKTTAPPRRTLGEIAIIKTGTKPDKIEKVGLYEYINAGTTNSGFTGAYNCAGNTVTTPSRGQGGIGFIGYQKESFWLGPLCYRINSKDSRVCNKFIYYSLCAKTADLLKLKKEGGVPALNIGDLERVKIPIPPLEEQHRIVSILDRFDALCNDLTSGLPAEIAARQKQYEYYRDKLLAFPVKKA